MSESITVTVVRTTEVEEQVTLDLPLVHPETDEPLVLDLSRSSDPGNAFAYLGAAQKSMQRAGVDKAVIDAFMSEAKSGDYDHLVQTCYRWFDEVRY